MRTTSAPSNPDGRGLEPNGPEDVPCAVLGPFSLIDRQGCEVLFRPLVQADRPTAARLFPGLSAQTRFRRFNSLYANLTDKQLTSLFDLDYRDRFAWAVEIACDGMTAPVAVGRYTRYAGSRRADVGITIRDQWHGRGLGGSLLDPLVITAHHNGFVAFDTIVTADNQPMLHLLRQRGAELSIPTTGEVDAVLPLSGIIGQLTDHPLARMLTTATTAPSLITTTRWRRTWATQFRLQWGRRQSGAKLTLPARSPAITPAVRRAVARVVGTHAFRNAHRAVCKPHPTRRRRGHQGPCH